MCQTQIIIFGSFPEIISIKDIYILRKFSVNLEKKIFSKDANPNQDDHGLLWLLVCQRHSYSGAKAGGRVSRLIRISSPQNVRVRKDFKRLKWEILGFLGVSICGGLVWGYFGCLKVLLKH